jgi:hypothetical protein
MLHCHASPLFSAFFFSSCELDSDTIRVFVTISNRMDISPNIPQRERSSFAFPFGRCDHSHPQRPTAGFNAQQRRKKLSDEERMRIRVQREHEERLRKLDEQFKGSSVILGESRMCIDAVGWLDGRSFELLYRAPRDGWSSGDFHRCCDNRGPTLVVARCSDGFVFGGYAAAAWNSSGAFIKAQETHRLVTLKNPHNIPPTRYNRKKPQLELMADQTFGPSIWLS